MELILFIFASAGTLAGGVGVIISRQPVRSALSLLLVLGSLAIMYLLLAAEFIAVLQVVVYAGAIIVLFLFVIMLLHARTGEARVEKLRWQRPVSLAMAVAFLAALLSGLRPGALPIAPIGPGFGTAQAVGRALFTAYLLPFEVASVILLVGIMAAVVIGKPASRPVTAAREASRTAVHIPDK